LFVQHSIYTVDWKWFLRFDWFESKSSDKNLVNELSSSLTVD